MSSCTPLLRLRANFFIIITPTSPLSNFSASAVWRTAAMALYSIDRPVFRRFCFCLSLQEQKKKEQVNMAALVKRILINPVLRNNGIHRLQFVRLAACKSFD